jgi:electron transport complex protein RnfD
MIQVIIALLPGTIAYTWFFGPGVIINICLAVLLALAFEAGILKLRAKPVMPHLTDFSAVVAAWLFALCLPMHTPWWLVLVGIGFSMVAGKHLYGGLGFNPFNPAMVGYVVLLISFPREMTTWYLPSSVSGETLSLKGITVGESRMSPVFGEYGGKGWEWIAFWWFVGGLWLLVTRTIRWHIPLALLGAVLAMSLIFYLVNPETYTSPLFHLLSGAVVIGAFFIATDPVTAATTDTGRIYYGLLIGCLIYVIRVWGGYPDGVAFAVLLANMCVPLIDYYTQPRVYGEK